MKKKHLCAAWRILAGVAILTSMVSVRAQVSNPSAWFDFVSGSGNPLVTDTFRTQTLQQLSTDNWEYETKGGALLPAGAKTLRIPLGGIISFTPFSAEGYKNVKIKFRYAGDKLIEEEDLSIRYTSLGKMKDRTLYSPVVKDGKTDAGFNYRVCLIEDSPSSLEIYTNDPAPNSQGGFYLVNSFTAYGDIPRYSLFSGSGNWNDTVRWSHLPPLHERGALINGAVTIDTSVECQTASLTNDSRLNITQNAHFIVDTLSLYNADISLTADGELTVNKQVTIYYTFPSKGKWHFVSFPFNVRPKGLDERFQWKDDSFSGKGNYLYVQIYDGGKRAINNKVTGNWTVLSPNTFSGDFLFEKGKGYLIALDAAASDNTLAFSVDASNLPDDFGKTTSIPVSATSATDEANSGWYLCGNPLPAPLSLSQIASDPLLDGNIYLYEESKYKAYPIGSNIIVVHKITTFKKPRRESDKELKKAYCANDIITIKNGVVLAEVHTINGIYYVLYNANGREAVRYAYYLSADVVYTGSEHATDYIKSLGNELFYIVSPYLYFDDDRAGDMDAVITANEFVEIAKAQNQVLTYNYKPEA